MDFLQGKTILHNGNESVSADVALKKKTLILYYFSSFDCDTCRVFDTKLREVFSEASYRRVELAIVIVCVDESEEDFYNNLRHNYYEWYALKFQDELSQALIYNYGVTHTPSLIVVRRNGAVVTKEGKKDVESFGINVLVIWSE